MGADLPACCNEQLIDELEQGILWWIAIETDRTNGYALCHHSGCYANKSVRVFFISGILFTRRLLTRRM
jgi:hypothetical protein